MFPWERMYWQYWVRLDAEFAAATTKAISVTMDVELLTRFWQNRSFWDNIRELLCLATGRKISPSITCVLGEKCQS